MDIKAWLSEYCTLQPEANQLFEQLENLRANPSPISQRRAEDIEIQLEKILDKRDQIEKAINALVDPLERRVIRQRYLYTENGGKTKWRKVAKIIRGNDAPKDLKFVFRCHKSALKNLAYSFRQ